MRKRRKNRQQRFIEADLLQLGNPRVAPDYDSIVCQYCFVTRGRPPLSDCRAHAKQWRVPFSRYRYNILARRWEDDDLPGQVKIK